MDRWFCLWEAAGPTPMVHQDGACIERTRATQWRCTSHPGYGVVTGGSSSPPYTHGFNRGVKGRALKWQLRHMRSEEVKIKHRFPHFTQQFWQIAVWRLWYASTSASSFPAPTLTCCSWNFQGHTLPERWQYFAFVSGELTFLVFTSGTDKFLPRFLLCVLRIHRTFFFLAGLKWTASKWVSV